MEKHAGDGINEVTVKLVLLINCGGQQCNLAVLPDSVWGAVECLDRKALITLVGTACLQL